MKFSSALGPGHVVIYPHLTDSLSQGVRVAGRKAALGLMPSGEVRGQQLSLTKGSALCCHIKGSCGCHFASLVDLDMWGWGGREQERSCPLAETLETSREKGKSQKQ